jgi:uncharacterized repeat protein (TIGR01451 family)
MRKRGLLHLSRLALLLLALATGLVGTPMPVAFAQGPPPRTGPPPQPPSPPTDRPMPSAVAPGPTAGGHGEREGAPLNLCSTVHGFVINWGYRNEPKLPIDLSGDSWQTRKLTDDNGFYASDCLGIGVGLLNLAVPPGMHPMTTDVAIRLGYRTGFEVNLGLYGGEVTPSLEVTPAMAVNSVSVLPGETLTYTVRVTNTLRLPDAGSHMGDVIITDLLPESLSLVAMTSTVGAVELWGRLLTADIGDLAPGQTVTITATTTLQKNTSPGVVIINRASLIYGGHVAVQTLPVTVEVKAAQSPANTQEIGFPTILPVTGAEHPNVEGCYWTRLGQTIPKFRMQSQLSPDEVEVQTK